MSDALLVGDTSVAAAVAHGRDALTAAGCDTPLLDAQLLLCEVLGVGRERLVLDREDLLSDCVRERYEATPEEVVRPKLLLTGRELIAAGYAPGPQFNQMLHAVEDAQLEGSISTAEEAMALVRERFSAAQARE